MQHVVVLDLFIGIEMKPALAALVLRPAVPGDRKRLYPAVRKFDQILLEGIDAEGVFHLEGRKLAVGAVGFDKELIVLPEEAGMDAVIVETGIIEIAEHGGGGRVLHRMLVLGFLPQRGFGLVASGAGFAADKGGGSGSIAGAEQFVRGEIAIGNEQQGEASCHDSREPCHHRYAQPKLSRSHGGSGIALSASRAFGRLRCGGAP